MAITIGQPAPDFKLVNDQREEVALSQFKGKNVVLLFFPLAFTSVCTAELCSVRDGMKTYEELDAQVLGISVDAPPTLARFKDDQGLNFPLLSDFNKNVSQEYGAFYEQFAWGLKGVSKRAAFVIDQEGVIQYAEVLDNAGEQPNFEQIQGKLRSLAK